MSMRLTDKQFEKFLKEARKNADLAKLTDAEISSIRFKTDKEELLDLIHAWERDFDFLSLKYKHNKYSFCLNGWNAFWADLHEYK